MITLRGLARHGAVAALLAWAAMPPSALGTPLRVKPSARTQFSAVARPARPVRPLPGEVPVTLACGAIGALAAELAADRRRLQAPESWLAWLAGMTGRAAAGAVFGLFLVSLIPPDGSWLRLGSAALAGGVAGGAVLLAMLAARRVHAAEQERDSAREQAVVATTLAIETIETFRVMALAALPCAGTPHEDGGGFEHLMNSYADRAKAEIAATVG